MQKKSNTFIKKIDEFETTEGLFFLIKRLYQSYIKNTKAKKLFFQGIFFMFVLAVANSMLLFIVKPMMNSFKENAAAPGIFKKSSKVVVDSYNSSDFISNISTNGSFVDFVYIAILLSFIVFIADFLKEYKMKYAQSCCGAFMRKDLFFKFLRSDLVSIDSISTGRVITSLVSDPVVIRSNLSNFIIILFKDSLTVIGLMCVLIFNNRVLLIFTLLSFAILGPFFIMINKKIKKHLLKIYLTDQKFNHQMITIVNNIKTIKSTNSQSHQNNKFSDLLDEYISIEKKNSRYASIFSPFVQFISVFISVLVIIFFVKVNNGLFGDFRISIGEISSYSLTMIVLYKPLKSLGRLNFVGYSLLISLRKMFAMIDFLNSSVYDSINDIDKDREVIFENFQSISFNDVSLKINDFEILKNINFNIKKGDNIGFVGETGSGKSSIANILLRFYIETSGSVEFNGKRILNSDTYYIRSKIAYIYQNELLFNETIFYNITYGVNREVQDEELKKAVEIAHCSFIYEFENGLNTTVGKNGVNLSGGQIQRLFIVRAILRDCEIFIFDEFTSALDVETEAKIISKLKDSLKDKTIINISHKINLIKNYDTVYVIKSGQIVESGSYDDLINKKEGFLKNMFLSYNA